MYYQDTDAGGLVYHAQYLAFGERARAEAMRALGVPVAELIARHNVMFVVRRLQMDYQRPARLDEVLNIATTIQEVGGASAKLRQHFRRDSDSLAVLDVELACARLADGRAARLPEVWRAAMRAARD